MSKPMSHCPWCKFVDKTVVHGFMFHKCDNCGFGFHTFPTMIEEEDREKEKEWRKWNEDWGSFNEN